MKCIFSAEATISNEQAASTCIKPKALDRKLIEDFMIRQSASRETGHLVGNSDPQRMKQHICWEIRKPRHPGVKRWASTITQCSLQQSQSSSEWLINSQQILMFPISWLLYTGCQSPDLWLAGDRPAADDWLAIDRPNVSNRSVSSCKRKSWTAAAHVWKWGINKSTW